jgi:hypothetical protein
VSGWEVVNVHEDLDADDGHRWLIVYSVPVEYAPDGVYSVSLPKDIFNNWAAVYGYDVDDPQDVDALFNHVTYHAYINEVLRKEGRADEIVANPFELGADEARARVQAHVAEFKASRPLGTASAATSPGGRSSDPHDVIRADMATRLDRAAVDKHMDAVKQARKTVMAKVAARKARR